MDRRVEKDHQNAVLRYGGALIIPWLWSILTIYISSEINNQSVFCPLIGCFWLVIITFECQEHLDLIVNYFQMLNHQQKPPCMQQLCQFETLLLGIFEIFFNCFQLV